jgi:hypothetical protein
VPAWHVRTQAYLDDQEEQTPHHRDIHRLSHHGHERIGKCLVMINCRVQKHDDLSRSLVLIAIVQYPQFYPEILGGLDSHGSCIVVSFKLRLTLRKDCSPRLVIDFVTWSESDGDIGFQNMELTTHETVQVQWSSQLFFLSFLFRSGDFKARKEVS